MSKITNRKELLEFYHHLLLPTKKYQQMGNGRLKFGTTSAHYTDEQAEIEGFLRLLWGVGPLSSQGITSDFTYYQEGILAGVNPESPYYWGKVNDFDQLIVEMAALAVTLMETKEEFWDQLESVDQANLIHWLDQINGVGVHKNNWLFFRILVNVLFIKLDAPFSEEQLSSDLAAINEMYVGNGWYFDGNPQQMDYYIPWAFHYYGLIYAKEMIEIDPEQGNLFKERAILFAHNFKYWFDENGAGVPFGRSLTYRFAQIAFWSALVYANVEALPWGEIKGLILHHFSYWSEQKITKADGILSLGYTYENLYLTESYNSPGSPYWSFKSFLLLSVEKNHPFWLAEASLPGLSPKLVIPEAKMILTNQDQQNILLYPADQWTNQAHANEKYSKFVYSSRFGFSVSKDSVGLNRGAFDNTLAIAEKGFDSYQTKSHNLDFKVTENYLYYKWQPMPQVEVESWVVPLGTWHVRFHNILTEREIEVADGGFSNQTKSSHLTEQQIEYFPEGLMHSSSVGTIASFNLKGYQEVRAIMADANTNLLFSQTVIPTVMGSFKLGRHHLASAHFASVSEKAQKIPKVILKQDEWIVSLAEKTIHIPLI